MADSPSSASPFERLLADAQQGGQAKVDALVALAQRTVHVPTWGQGDTPSYRTLTNANGQTALPIFSSAAQLQAAAAQFGWQEPDGTVASKELGARGALNYAIGHDLHFVVVDISAPHSLDVDREEIEPLLSPAARRESSGPYAGVGRISSSMIRAVKPSGAVTVNLGGQNLTDPSAGGEGARGPGASPVSPGAALTASVSDEPIAVTTFGSGSSVSVHKLNEEPAEALLTGLAEVLRGYPEVEWAALSAIARGPSAPMPTVALKVDAAFRQRVNEIIQRLRGAGDELGASLDVLLLDDPAVMRTVRSEAKLFYPWKR